jgi:hypothetical protein
MTETFNNYMLGLEKLEADISKNTREIRALNRQILLTEYETGLIGFNQLIIELFND